MKPLWKQEEIDLLRKHIGTMGGKELSKIIGRSQAAVVTKAKDLGLKVGHIGVAFYIGLEQTI